MRDEAFFAEKELTKGEGGKLFAPGGAEVEWVDEPTYYFRLSNWGDRLLEHYEAHADFILPHTRRNEVVNFVKQGLEDLSISRTTFDWGVPVPDAPGHVMYVWLDALTNYITGVGYPDTGADSFKRYWPADVHIIGKDIVRFHAIYWPAFLMAAGLEPPKRVFGHGFLNIDGEKMSKSLGNVLTPATMVGAYGLDQIRYFLMREVPFGGDGSFSHEAIVQRINADLANDFGNLAQRILSMIAKNCDGVLPAPGDLSAADEAILAAARDLVGAMRKHVEQQAFHRGATRVHGCRQRNQRLCRWTGALGVGENRSRAHADGALGGGRGDPLPGDPRAARSARRGGQNAGSVGCAGGRAHFRAPRRKSRAAAGNAAAEAERRVPAVRRGGVRQGRRLMLVDSHCHLDFDVFEGRLDSVLADAGPPVSAPC